MNTVSHQSVWALLVDQQGVLWTGTYGGLSRYSAEEDHFINYSHDEANENSLSHNLVWSLHEDSAGNMWVGTALGLNRFNREQKNFTRFLHNPQNQKSLSSNVVNAIFEDQQGILWVATDRGLNKFNAVDQTFQLIADKENILPTSVVTAISEDAAGHLWVGTDGNGIFILDETQRVVNHKTYQAGASNGLSTNKIKVLIKDRKQQLWIGTDNGGLLKYDSGSERFELYQYNPSNLNSLSENVIHALYEDRSGVLWIGTYTKGISKLNPYGFSKSLVLDYPTLENPDPHTDIRAFYIDRKQNLWVGSSSNGIRVTLANGDKLVFRHDPQDPTSLSSDKVYSIYEDRAGTLWVGTANGWLNEYVPARKAFIRYQTQPETADSVRHGKILAIREDHSGLLWAALERGAAHTFDRKTKQFTHYHPDTKNPNTICGDRVFGMVVDRQNNIWFGTYGDGLCKFDQKKQLFTTYQHDDANPASISSNFISALVEDDNDAALWIALYGQGLARFDMESETFRNFSEQQGLPDKNTYSVLQSKNDGSIWVSHNKGLSRLAVGAETFYNYQQKDGLQSNEFNGGAHYRATDGKLFFGGIAGYNAFYPEQIVDNPNKPLVYITDFQLFNKSVVIDEKYDGRVLLPSSIIDLSALTLSYKDSVFSFEFTALDYAAPSKNQYAYRMEGLETEWNYVDSQRRFATYTTLPAGSYTFQVKASNSNGVWNEVGTQLAITITPPFWQTWWFRITVGILLIMTVFAIYWLRVRAVHERNKMLNEQVKLRTADLEKALYELGETKDALIEAAHKAGMADTAIGVLHNVGNILNSVNTSASVIRETVDNTVCKKFFKANELLLANKENILDFLSNNPKGLKLLHYIMELEGPFKIENDSLRENAVRLKEKIDDIREVIVAQQRVAQGGSLVEERALPQMVEDCLSLQAGSINRHEIRIERYYNENVPKIKIQKAKLMQVLLNLYKNAKESMDASPSSENILTLEIKRDSTHAYIGIGDTGLSIAKDSLEKIFAHGYTGKDGHEGHGLHVCANYMSEMGGRIWAESDGPGRGAKFILSFPLKQCAAEEHSRAA